MEKGKEEKERRGGDDEETERGDTKGEDPSSTCISLDRTTKKKVTFCQPINKLVST